MSTLDPARRRAESQALRAFIDAKKREVVAAEKKYDIKEAVQRLKELSYPLWRDEEVTRGWKELYLEVFYRDIAKFVLDFVAVHLEVAISAMQRQEAFDVFFALPYVPSTKSIGVLATVLSATKMNASLTSDEGDAQITIGHCIRLLESVLEADGLKEAVVAMLTQEDASVDGRAVITFQPLVSHLASLPDLIYNRRQRESPSLFKPSHYFPLLGKALFGGLFDHYAQKIATKSKLPQTSIVFRMFSDKMIRIGQTEMLMQSWLHEQKLYESHSAAIQELLLKSLPESCYEAVLLHISSENRVHDQDKEAKTLPSSTASKILRSPKYRLLSAIPAELTTNKQFQYVVAHKLLLRKPVGDFFFLRVLADVLARKCENVVSHEEYVPLARVFDIVVSRWSQSDFSTTVDQALNASVAFFLRYSMRCLRNTTDFTQQEWVAKLCKGVQDHMNHSLKSVRLLGMRVGESLSIIISPENPLNFEIEETDPMDVYGVDVEVSIIDSVENFDLSVMESALVSSKGTNKREKKKKKKRTSRPFSLDPDELVLSDEESVSDDKEDENLEDEDASDSESDSDMSLEAYDMTDEEEDLKTKKPLYLKDLIAGLHAEDDREKTEAALHEAETLLRKRPRDLQDNAKAVVTALLRLEDKYNTPNFVILRANALAAACTLAPVQIVPYFHSQALEREQLFQSRIDVLQAMIMAAQELSESGDFVVHTAKSLLAENTMETRTMRGMKTRRWGYRRDPLMSAKKNAFAKHALGFFSPLLFGYVEYVRTHSGSKGLSDLEQMFLAHLLHALACFVECAGHSPQTISMAKCLMEFAWHERNNQIAAVRRQVLFAFSRVLLVVPPFLLRQEMGNHVLEMMTWLQQVHRQDPDEGCREASRLLLSSGSIPMVALP